MAVFFASDTHFGHAGARSLYRRPFDSVAAMDATILERWNATVRPEDEVQHLGDLALSVSEAAMAEHLGQAPCCLTPMTLFEIVFIAESIAMMAIGLPAGQAAAVLVGQARTTMTFADTLTYIGLAFCAFGAVGEWAVLRLID